MIAGRKRAAFAALAFCVFTLVALPTVCPAEIQLIRVQNRDAAGLVPAVQILLSETGRVSVDRQTNSLIVKDTAEVLQTVRQAVTDMDLAPEQLTIHFRFDEQDLTSHKGGRVSARASGSDWSVGTADRDADGVSVRFENSKLNRDRQDEFSVTVLSGNTAYVRTGAKIPLANRWAYLTDRCVHMAETVNLETVDTGFEVRPTVFGANVRLEIVPRIAQPDPHQGRTIRFTEASTVLVVPRGKWVSLSENTHGGNEVVGEILSTGKTKSAGRRVLSILVDP